MVTHNYTQYLDVKLRLTPRQWANFAVPYGIGIIWDDYNMQEQTVVGRFYCSLAHENIEQRKTEEELDRFLESMGRYVITTNAVHSKIRKIESDGIVWGQRTVTHQGHPYLKQVPSDIDVHLSEKDNDLKQFVTKDVIDGINYTIKDNAYRFRELKNFRDERFKPRQVYDSNGKTKYEIYTAVLEEIQ